MKVALVGLVLAAVASDEHGHPRSSANLYGRAVRPLVDAVGERRFLEARLTGGFKFGPLIASVRSGATDTFGEAQIYAAAAGLRDRVRRGATAENERALAAACLLTGDADQAVVLLERLAQERGPEPELLSDLSAAYLTRAQVRGTASDHGAALDAATRAVHRAPELPEALFNQALALERLGLRSEARERWGIWAHRFADSPWSEEATRRSRRAQAAPAADGVDEESVRRRLEEDVPYEWASGAEPDLDGARALAAALAQTRGEAFHADLIGQLGSAQGRPPSLVGGLTALQESQHAAESDRWEESYARATRAHSLLSQARSPFGWLAAVRRGNALYYLSRLPEAERVLSAVLRDCPSAYLAPRARSLWLLGLVRFVQGRPYEAAQLHEEGRRLYEALGERAHVVFLQGLIAQDLFALGRDEQAWAQWSAVAAALDDVRLPPRREFTVLWESARRLLPDRPAAALELLNRAVHTARRAEDPGLVAAALVRRARAAARCGRLDGARSDLREATALVTRMSGSLRRAWERDLEVLRLEIRAREAGSTGAQLGAVAAEMARAGNQFEALDVRELAAHELMAAGQRPEAIEEIRQILSLGAAAEGPIRDPVDGAVFRRRLLNARLDLAQLYLAEGQPWSAYLAAQEDESPQDIDAALARVEALQRGLTEDAAMVQVLPVRQGVHRWTVRHHGLDAGLHRPVAMTTESLERLLVEVLAAEVARGTKRILVLPLGRLSGLSWGRLFAAAEAGGDGALLGLASEKRLPTPVDRPGEARRVVAVATSRAVGIGPMRLAALPEVEREVQTLRDLYGPRLTRARVDSPDAFARALDGADVVHVAGHATLDPFDPTRSALVVGTEGGGSFAVYVSDIARTRWRNPPRLVVLSVCRGAEEARNTVSLAQAFLMAGVGTVVAATETVEDGDARHFAAELHHRLRQGEPPLLAVRGARQACPPASRTCQAFATVSRALSLR